jgi:hypothetical protein
MADPARFMQRTDALHNLRVIQDQMHVVGESENLRAGSFLQCSESRVSPDPARMCRCRSSARGCPAQHDGGGGGHSVVPMRPPEPGGGRKTGAVSDRVLALLLGNVHSFPPVHRSGERPARLAKEASSRAISDDALLCQI